MVKQELGKVGRLLSEKVIVRDGDDAYGGVLSELQLTPGKDDIARVVIEDVDTQQPISLDVEGPDISITRIRSKAEREDISATRARKAAESKANRSAVMSTDKH